MGAWSKIFQELIGLQTYVVNIVELSRNCYKIILQVKPVPLPS